MTRFSRGLAAASFILVLLSGCGKPSVSGTVTLDGKPVDGGVISFVADGTNKQANADIVGGKYDFGAKPGPTAGKNKVEILWNKKTGRKIPVPGDPGNMTDESVQAIPAQYNSASTLTADVKSGANKLDFTLTSR
ncbi:MAG: hypothetical protein U0736_15950 [Gemmataceae bacterium]